MALRITAAYKGTSPGCRLHGIWQPERKERGC